MNQHWRQVKSSNTQDDDGAEIPLVAFGGTCFLYNKTGHKANTCPMKNKTNRGNSNSNNGNGAGNNGGYQRFKGKCNNCGKTGHMSFN